MCICFCPCFIRENKTKNKQTQIPNAPIPFECVQSGATLFAFCKLQQLKRVKNTVFFMTNNTYTRQQMIQTPIDSD